VHISEGATKLENGETNIETGKYYVKSASDLTKSPPKPKIAASILSY